MKCNSVCVNSFRLFRKDCWAFGDKVVWLSLIHISSVPVYHCGDTVYDVPCQSPILFTFRDVYLPETFGLLYDVPHFLDVYKRQAEDCFLKVNGEPYSLGGAMCLDPVSYTHLDVYKRQM